MQAQHEATEAELAGGNPVLAQVQQVVVQDEGEEGKDQVETAPDTRIHARNRNAKDDKVELLPISPVFFVKSLSQSIPMIFIDVASASY